MPFSDTTLSKYAFKKLLGVAHTTNTFDHPNEALGTQVSIAASQIMGSSVSQTPTTAVSDNVAELITADLEAIVASSGKAWRAKFPSGYSGYFSTLPGFVAQDYISNWTFAIPQSFGSSVAFPSTGYAARLKNNGVDVPVGDSTNWVFDPYACIVVSETNLSLVNGTVQFYLYRGVILQDFIDKAYYTHTQGSSSSTWNVSHNLGRMPSVSIRDSSDVEIEGVVEHTNVDSLVIKFNKAITGAAYCV